MHANCRAACGLCVGAARKQPAGATVFELPELDGVDWDELQAFAKANPATPAELAADCEGVDSFLSPEKMPGLHIMCRLPAPAAPPGGEVDGGATFTRLAIWVDAHRPSRRADGGAGSPTVVVALPGKADDDEMDVPMLIQALGARLQFRARGENYQDPAIFSTGGDRLVTAEAVSGERLLCFFEGGQWIWPPGNVGTVRQVPLPNGRTARIKTLSTVPVVLEVEDFLEGSETKHIVNRAAPHLKKSGVSLKTADIGKEAKEWRTSSQHFLSTDGDPKLEAIDTRVQSLVRIPITHAEYIQVLQYNHKEHYSSHHDYFDTRDYAGNEAVLRDTLNGARNRLITVFFYLSDVAEGGATNFPRAGGGPVPRDYFDCSHGLSVYPKDGKVVIFYSLHPSSDMNPYSLHGGCDVLNGTKFSANFWLWNQPYHFGSHARRSSAADFKGATWR